MFHELQIKRELISTKIDTAYELPYQFMKGLRLKILGN